MSHWATPDHVMAPSPLEKPARRWPRISTSSRTLLRAKYWDADQERERLIYPQKFFPYPTAQRS